MLSFACEKAYLSYMAFSDTLFFKLSFQMIGIYVCRNSGREQRRRDGFLEFGEEKNQEFYNGNLYLLIP